MPIRFLDGPETGDSQVSGVEEPQTSGRKVRFTGDAVAPTVNDVPALLAQGITPPDDTLREFYAQQQQRPPGEKLAAVARGVGDFFKETAERVTKRIPEEIAADPSEARMAATYFVEAPTVAARDLLMLGTAPFRRLAQEFKADPKTTALRFAGAGFNPINWKVLDFLAPPKGSSPDAEEKRYQNWKLNLLEKSAMSQLPASPDWARFGAKPYGNTAELLSYVLDPTNLGSLGTTAAGKQLVRGATRGLVDATVSGALKSAPGVGERVAEAAGRAAEKVGMGARVAGEAPERLARGATEAVLGPETAEKAAEATKLGAIAGVPSGLVAAGAGLTGMGALAVTPGALKAGGTAAEAVGRFAQRLAAADRTSPFGRFWEVAHSAEAPEWMARLANSLPIRAAKRATEFGGDVARGAAVGSAIGAGMGLLTADSPEEFGQALGAGAGIGGVGHAVAHPALRRARLLEKEMASVVPLVERHLQQGVTPEQLKKLSDADLIQAATIERIFGPRDPAGTSGVQVKFLPKEQYPGGKTAGFFWNDAPKTLENGNVLEGRTLYVNLDNPGRRPGETLLHELGHPLFDWAVGRSPEFRADLEATLESQGVTPLLAKRKYAEALVDPLFDRGRRGTDEHAQAVAQTIAQKDADSLARYGDADYWVLSEIFAEAVMRNTFGKSLVRDVLSPSLTQRAFAPVMDFLSDWGVDFRQPRPGTILPGFEHALDLPEVRKLAYRALRERRDYAPTLDRGWGFERGRKLTRADVGTTPAVPREGGTFADLAAVTPAGEIVLRKPALVNQAVRARTKLVNSLVPEGLPLPATDKTPTVAARVTETGQVERAGTAMPEAFYADARVPSWLKRVSKALEDAIANGAGVRAFYNGIAKSGATDWSKSVRETLGNVESTVQDFVPFRLKVSKVGHLLAEAFSSTALERKAQRWASRSGELSLDLWGKDVGAFRADVEAYLRNHAEGRPGSEGLGEQKRDVINAFLVGGNRTFEAKNPLRRWARGEDRQGIVRSYRLDRLESLEPYDLGWARPDYRKQVLNLSPEGAAEQTFDAAFSARGKNFIDNVNEDVKNSPVKTSKASWAVKGQVPLIHYSRQAGLSLVDPGYLGKGKATPADLRGGPVAFYFVKGSDFGGDAGLFDQSHVYEAVVPGAWLYDAGASGDPLRFYDTANRQEAFNRIKKAGFKGVLLRTEDGREVVALFEPQAVRPLGYTEVAGAVAGGPVRLRDGLKPAVRLNGRAKTREALDRLGEPTLIDALRKAKLLSKAEVERFDYQDKIEHGFLDEKGRWVRAADAYEPANTPVSRPEHLKLFTNEDTLEAALARPGWAIVTATQEALGPHTAKVNVEANKRLAAELRKEKRPFLKVGGKYKGQDQGESFLVLGVTPEQALQLGRQWGQESVFTPDGLLYTDGTISPLHHDKTTFGYVAQEQDGYTEIPNGPSFSLGVDWGTRVPYKSGETATAAASPQGPRVIEVAGPDGKTYPVRFDGWQDLSVIGRGVVAQLTPLVDLPGVTVKHSTTYSPKLEQAGYTLPKLDSPAAAAASPQGYAPHTEAGKALLKDGRELRLEDFGTGSWKLRLLGSDGEEIAALSAARTPDAKEATIGSVFVDEAHRGQGIAEALYREAASLMQDFGVERISGMVVHPAPEKIRRKLFGEPLKAEEVGVPDAWGRFAKDMVSRLDSAAVFSAEGKAEPPKLPKKFRFVPEWDNGALHVYREDRPVGSLVFRPVGEHTVELEQLEVSPAYQRRGLGEALLREFRASLPEQFPQAKYVSVRSATSQGVLDLTRKVFPLRKQAGTEALPTESPTDWRDTPNKAYAQFTVSNGAPASPQGAYWAGDGKVERAPEGHEAWLLKRVKGTRRVPADDFDTYQRNYELGEQAGFNRVILDQDAVKVQPSDRYPTWEALPTRTRAALEDFAFANSVPLMFGRRTVLEPSAQLAASPQKAAAPGFFSKLDKVVEEKFQGQSMPAAQLAAILRKPQSGVRPAELEWSGLADFLRGKERVTKDEVKQVLAENSLPLEEAVLSGPEAKYSQYTLPGGANYRELLLTLPAQEPEQAFHSTHFKEPNVVAHARFDERIDAQGKRTLFLEEVQSDWAQQGRKRGFLQRGEARADALARARKAVEAEEAALGKEGYRFEPLYANAATQSFERAVRNSEGELVGYYRGYGDNGLKDPKIGKLLELYHNAHRALRGDVEVPAMPFSSSWVPLVLKRMLRWAVDNGFEKLAWTTGEQQANRYSLAKRLSVVEATKNQTQGAVLKLVNVLAYNPAGEVVFGRWVPEARLAEVVGKDLAQTILSQPPGKRTVYSGLDLKVGGEGMVGFYDEVLPAEMNKLVGKLGGKVTTTKIPLHAGELGIRRTSAGAWEVFEDGDSGNYGRFATRGDAETALAQIRRERERSSEVVHAIEITPQIRRMAEDGFPLFSPRGREAEGPDRVVAAATQHSSGKIGTGSNHSEATEHLLRQSTLPGVKELAQLESLPQEAQNEFWDKIEQGFVTKTGQFLSREDAAKAAAGAGQVSGKVTELHGEDLQASPVKPLALEPKVLSRYAKRIYAETLKNKGATFNPASGKMYRYQKDPVFIVSLYPEHTEKVPAAEFTPQHVENYITRMAHLLGDPELSVGTWLDKDGNIQLDVSMTTANKAFAEYAGKKFNQIAAYDLKAGADLPTGGDGTPLEHLAPDTERMALLRKEYDTLFPTIGQRQLLGRVSLTDAQTRNIRDLTRVWPDKDLTPTERAGAMLARRALRERVQLLEHTDSRVRARRALQEGVPAVQEYLRRQEAGEYDPDRGFNSGRDWYRQDISAMERTMEQIFPELKQPTKMTIFKLLLAVYSSGEKPKANLQHAAEAFAYYLRTGEVSHVTEFRVDPSGRHLELNRQARAVADRINSLLHTLGGEAALAEYLVTKHPDPKFPDGKYGALSFGPKLGRFFLNLMGYADEVTVDLWMMRLWNQWMGTPFKEVLDKDTKQLKHELPQTPASEEQRAEIMNAVREIGKQVGIGAMDAQAVLWFVIKDAYASEGVNVDRGMFSKAASEYAKDPLHARATPKVMGLKPPSKRRLREAETLPLKLE